MAYSNERNAAVIDREAELHNSRINNMYSILKNAESEQLEQLWAEAKREARASVIAPEKPVETPVYEHTRVESDIFTPAALERTLERTMPVQTPTYAPVQSNVEQQSEAVTYSLTTAAKKAIAIFATAATVMLATICVNTQIIKNREAQIMALEASNASTRASIVQIEEQLAHESSEEAIREWAIARGLTD